MLQCAIRPEDARAIPINGWYAGTDAIQKGELFVYDSDYGTATTADGSRVNRIVRPTVTGDPYLRTVAGVAARNYSAVAQGQKIELLAPGSYAEIPVLSAPTIGETVTGIASTAGNGLQGKFGFGGFPGRGTATVLRTVAAIASTSDLSEGWISESLDANATYTASTKTVGFTNIAQYIPDGITSADKIYVYIVGGVTDATGANQVTIGRYLVASKTSADALVLVDSAGANDGVVICFVVRGNPTVPALLHGSPFPGSMAEESGLIDFVNPDSGAAAAPVPMPGGWTWVFSGFAGLAADSTAALADGAFNGQRKGFGLYGGALTTGGFKVTSAKMHAMVTDVANATLAAADVQSLIIASFELAAANSFATVIWHNGYVAGSGFWVLDKALSPTVA